MEKINFQTATKVSEAKVTIDGVDYEVTPAVYSGTTAISATNLNKMQSNAEDAINELDTIVETDSNSNGSWIKYKNGTMIITQKVTTNLVASSWSSWGSMYSANLNAFPQYPVTFISPPTVSISTNHTGLNFWLYDRAGGGTVTQAPNMGAVRPTAGGESSITLHCTAIGRWK